MSDIKRGLTKFKIQILIIPKQRADPGRLRTINCYLNSLRHRIQDWVLTSSRIKTPMTVFSI